MNNFDKCPVCQSAKIDRQPESINGRQDVIYICGCSVTYEVDNPEDFERTIECKNKIDWEHIYVEYGGEFDESAKLVDTRFYGWVELEFYKRAHIINGWRNLINFMDKQFLDAYFENKEAYISNLIKNKVDISIDMNDSIGDIENLHINQPIVIRSYNQEPICGDLVLEQVKQFERAEYNVSLFRIKNFKNNPELVGGYILEEVCDNFKKNRITFYDKEIIELIIQNNSLIKTF
jgi:hypothetical protein